MPAGVLVASPILLPSIGSVSLVNANLPVWGASETWGVHPLSGPGISEEFIRAGLPNFADGYLTNAHGHAVFDKIHVIPRTKDLGAVGSLQEFDAEVWNAFRDRAQFLASLTATGAGNVTVLNPFSLPTHFAPTASKLYTVQVPGEGDPVIDALVTFVFTGLPSAGATDVAVLGFRMIPFGFEPNRADDIVETFGYLTNVLEAFDGTEQRVQLRETPIGTVGFSLLLDDKQDAQEANAILYGNQARPFGVPRWQFLTPLLSPAAADSLELLVDTASIPFEVGGLCLVWTGSRTWEAHTIAEIQADRVVLAFPLASAWPVGAKVMPLLIGRLSPEEVFAWESLSIGSQALVFSIDRFRP